MASLYIDVCYFVLKMSVKLAAIFKMIEIQFMPWLLASVPVMSSMSADFLWPLLCVGPRISLFLNKQIEDRK